MFNERPLSGDCVEKLPGFLGTGAPFACPDVQKIAGVWPGARILLRADGEPQVKAVLEVIDEIEVAGVDPCDAAPTYWRTVGNRLAARQPLPAYTVERHAAHLAREPMR